MGNSKPKPSKPWRVFRGVVGMIGFSLFLTMVPFSKFFVFIEACSCALGIFWDEFASLLKFKSDNWWPVLGLYLIAIVGNLFWFSGSLDSYDSLIVPIRSPLVTIAQNRFSVGNRDFDFHPQKKHEFLSEFEIYGFLKCDSGSNSLAVYPTSFNEQKYVSVSSSLTPGSYTYEIFSRRRALSALLNIEIGRLFPLFNPVKSEGKFEVFP